jgi:hypothetical protein
MPQHDPETKRVASLELSGLDDRRRVSLCETLDRVLNKGAVVAGEVTISVADVDLVYLGLHLVLSFGGDCTGRWTRRRLRHCCAKGASRCSGTEWHESSLNRFQTSQE